MCSYVLTGFISLETDFKKWKMANDPPKLQHLKRCVHQSVWGGGGGAEGGTCAHALTVFPEMSIQIKVTSD